MYMSCINGVYDLKEVIIIMLLSLEAVIVWILCGLATGMSSATPMLISNYDHSKVSEFATLSTPLEVPSSIQRNMEPRPSVPINEKYNLQYSGGKRLLI